MLGQINVVLKQALETFTCRREVFHQNIEKLKSFINSVTIDDVRLNPVLLSSNIWQKPNKAPATYVDIFQDDNVTMGIFVLKPDMTLPLHDHPDMHGVIKVLFGKIKITSYSVNSENISTLDNYCNQIAPHIQSHLIVEKDSEITIDSSSSCCILYPNHKNFHEIRSIGGPAAFMDILSPPYETLREDGELRRCNYYKVVSEIAPNIFDLQKIDSPSYFWTDSAPFVGKLFL